MRRGECWSSLEGASSSSWVRVDRCSHTRRVCERFESTPTNGNTAGARGESAKESWFERAECERHCEIFSLLYCSYGCGPILNLRYTCVSLSLSLPLSQQVWSFSPLTIKSLVCIAVQLTSCCLSLHCCCCCKCGPLTDRQPARRRRPRLCRPMSLPQLSPPLPPPPLPSRPLPRHPSTQAMNRPTPAATCARP